MVTLAKKGTLRHRRQALAFLRQKPLVQKLFAEKYPKVKTVFREKAGPYLDNDRKLWAEIKEKGDAMIMAMGH